MTRPYENELSRLERLGWSGSGSSLAWAADEIERLHTSGVYTWAINQGMPDGLMGDEQSLWLLQRERSRGAEIERLQATVDRLGVTKDVLQRCADMVSSMILMSTDGRLSIVITDEFRLLEAELREVAENERST